MFSAWHGFQCDKAFNFANNLQYNGYQCGQTWSCRYVTNKHI